MLKWNSAADIAGRCDKLVSGFVFSCASVMHRVSFVITASLQYKFRCTCRNVYMQMPMLQVQCV